MRDVHRKKFPQVFCNMILNNSDNYIVIKLE